MAGISKDPDGRKRIRFVGPDGKYYSLRLGKCDLRTATTVKDHVEKLLTATVTDTSPPRGPLTAQRRALRPLRLYARAKGG